MNGKYEVIEQGKAILLALLSLVIAISIAFFIVINMSPLFVTIPNHLLGLSRPALLADYSRIIAYLQLPGIQPLRLKYVPITGTAIDHFKDVKRLVLFNELLIVTIGPLLFYMFKLQKRQNQLWRLILPFQMLFILLVFGGFVGLTNFSSYFIEFHYLFFSNMDWVFNPAADPIIELMPESFFELLFSLWLVIALLIFLLIWGWVKLTLRAFFNKS
ncbi:TIGR01906 family membrane protein [Limosilactobacillus sp. STM2_1]|uniref:TIGR01906 family membrane protein n=1 Tax=Limosilactobacillus rudii TaxID=2759755 RepID=A0A7W3UN09_9LACO|nr:TIGR01906 family membrane protein [Limosilactobacillus rudii]MBB1079832.1 TIGR01906 family membrane protein [Limosilactobacillus rudii]MBB1097910.1 TIGR01906 family membrane protein [Limosilactobacillus rudii]MCD7134979.1 TIGR01906 family membrane protein [Limosilactobacillus rudii]